MYARAHGISHGLQCHRPWETPFCLFVCLFVPNEYKSNRSSIKSQDLSILFMSAQYTHSVAICHEEIQLTCFPGLVAQQLLTHTGCSMSERTLRCPLAWVYNHCPHLDPILRFFYNIFLRIVEIWARERNHLNNLTFCIENFRCVYICVHMWLTQK